MRKYTKAVSATLAGALAVGMVPAMALADEVELQAANDATAITNGAATKMVTTDNLYAEVAVADKVFTANGQPQYVVPTEVDPAGDNTDPVDIVAGENFNIVYYKQSATGAVTIPDAKVAGAAVKGDIATDLSAAGTYWAVAEGIGELEGAYVAVKYVINPAGDVAGAAYYEANPVNPYNLDDTTLEYTGKALDVQFKVGDKALVKGVDYTVEYYAGSIKVDSIVVKGAYTAKIKGIGAYTGTADVNLTVQDMNLGDIALPAQQVGSVVKPTIADVEGLERLSSDVVANLEIVNDGFPALPGVGYYTFAVQPKEDADQAVADALPADQTVRLYVYSKLLGESAFLYDGAAITEKTTQVNTKTLANGQVVYDTNKIAAMNGATPVSPTIEVLKSVDGGVNFVSAGNSLMIDKNTKAGIYKVTAKVADNANYALGGESATTTFVVYEGAIDLDATCYVTQDGKIVNSLSFKQGAAINVANNIELRDAAGAKITSGYSLAYYKKNADGTWAPTAALSSASAPGEYKVQIVSTTYELSGASEIPVTIYKPITFDTVRAGDADSWDADGTAIYIYEDDKEIVPAVEYLSDAKSPATALDDVYTLIPEGNYTLKYETFTYGDNGSVVLSGKWADKVSAPGNYRVYVFEVASSAYDALNGTHKSFDIQVVNDGYLDVDGDDWFAGAVYEAKQAGLMFGYGNGAIFGPYDNIIRGDFAMVVSRLAGKQANPNLENRVDYEKGWDTGFADVPENSYYAQAIAYVDSIGVFTGYENGKFGAEDELTREQAATVLYRLACKSGAPKVDAAALAAYADAGEISGYAKTAMAWCVQEGIFGVSTAYLNPGDTITRAETAAVVTRF